MKILRTILSLAILTAMLPVSAQETRLAAVLSNHVHLLASDSLSGRGFGFPEKYMAIDYITRQFEEAGFKKAFGDSYIHNFNQHSYTSLIEGKNIIGIIEGSHPVLKNEYILLGAHYDHLGWKTVNGNKVVYNGADDNASGVASIIEIGKMLMKQRESLGRSIIIAAFDGEEAGLIGSSAFASRAVPSLFDVRMMFSLDMVGMLEKNGGMNHAGFRSLQDGEKLAAEVIGRHGINIRKITNRIEYRTDTWHFALKGIPSVYISTGLVSPYHKPEDDAHLLDYEGMARISGMMADMTSVLSNREELGAERNYISHKTNPALTGGFRVGFGSSGHSYDNAHYKAKTVVAIEAGPEAQFRLIPNTGIWLQSGIMYQLAGSHTAAGKLRTHSLVPQADLMLTFGGGDIVKPSTYFLAGFYYNHVLAARDAGSAENAAANFADHDYGLRLGGGMSILNFRFNIVYHHGLNQQNTGGGSEKIFNRTVIFSTSYLF